MRWHTDFLGDRISGPYKIVRRQSGMRPFIVTWTLWCNDEQLGRFYRFGEAKAAAVEHAKGQL